MAFKIIETQEELDAIIKDRLERERTAIEKKYEGFLSPDDVKKKIAESADEIEKLKKAASEHQTSLEELKKAKEEVEAKVAKYETDSVKTRIALELGLPYKFAERLSGNTEDEIRKDAESFAEIITANNPGQPHHREADDGDDGGKSAYRSMLADLKKE